MRVNKEVSVNYRLCQLKKLTSEMWHQESCLIFLISAFLSLSFQAVSYLYVFWLSQKYFFSIPALRNRITVGLETKWTCELCLDCLKEFGLNQKEKRSYNRCFETYLHIMVYVHQWWWYHIQGLQLRLIQKELA